MRSRALSFEDHAWFAPLILSPLQRQTEAVGTYIVGGVSRGVLAAIMREHPLGDTLVSPWSRRAADTCRPGTCRLASFRSEPCRPEAPEAAAPYGADRRRRQRSAWPRMQPLRVQSSS